MLNLWQGHWHPELRDTQSMRLSEWVREIIRASLAFTTETSCDFFAPLNFILSTSEVEKMGIKAKTQRAGETVRLKFQLCYFENV